MGTISSLIALQLLKVVGKGYSPDPDLSLGLLFNVIWTRLIMLIRGIIRLRQVGFIGRSVRIRGKSRLRMGRMATIEDGAVVDAFAKQGVQIGPLSRIGAGTIISSTSHLSVVGVGLKMGRNSGIGEYGYMGCAGGITIGDDVIMGQFVTFHSQEHRYSNTDLLIRQQGVTHKGIRIGSNTWVGARVTFLDGSAVGKNSVVAAGAVVNGKFPDGAVLGGVPAKVIKMRMVSQEASE